jgi:phosphoenolpyruvate-protein kinase (PTS system EI component)
MSSRLTFSGVAASPGTALGLLHHIDQPPVATGRGPATDGSGEEVTGAFDAVAAQLLDRSKALRASGQADLADIVETNGYIALDRELRGAVLGHLGQGLSPADAVAAAVHEYAGMLAALDDPVLAERAADVRQVGRRVLAHLAGSESAAPDGPVVLAAHEIGAADLLEHGDAVVAALSVVGGPNSHASIIARSLGIPLITGIDPAILTSPAGSAVLADTRHATVTVTVDPGQAERDEAIAAMDAARRHRELLAAERNLPCQTQDGHPVGLHANIATPAEAKSVSAHCATGVGLLRTELPFLEARQWPTEAQHAAVLRPILGKLPGLPVTVRTLDFADDKFPPFLAPAAVNGRLGRGLPHMLADPAAFEHQFRAILAAGTSCDLHVMIPMVESPPELAACREILHSAAAALGMAPPPLGAMIELPEAVAAIGELAREAAFFSIGSNDLTCKMLGLDRRDPSATPAMAAHPAVLNAIAATVTGAHRRRRRVSVCGDAAADPLVIPLLVGLGCDTLSVAPAAVDEVRARVRRLTMSTCTEVASTALTLDTAEDVWQLVTDRCLPPLP